MSDTEVELAPDALGSMQTAGVTTMSVLDREMYSEAEAARYLRLPQSTLNYWLEGGERRGRIYPPVIRSDPQGHRAPVTCQLLLLPPSDAFLQRVTWDGDDAAGWRPHDDEASPVQIDPDLRAGRPAVRGISTAVVREHDDAGEDHEDIATDFGLTVDQVRWAPAFETSSGPLRRADQAGPARAALQGGRSSLLLRR